MTTSTPAIISAQELGMRWSTIDPFLFCVHHDDRYPQGNDKLGPDASLAGRDMGQDFAGKDGWRMYHGSTVPGFPAHPHRGFETVTVVREGLIDHSDSLGATARFGGGDVQWLTAGRGIVHAEMFPLLQRDRENRLELFQIWLNLPASHKMAEPHFKMFWSEQVPHHHFDDANGARTTVTSIAGAVRGADGRTAPTPPPDSWASQAQSDIAIWTLSMAPGARWTLPVASGKATRRSLYFFEGQSMSVGGLLVDRHAGLEVVCDRDIELVNGNQSAQMLMLQGKPIAEPVAQYGPFVMNTQAEIQQAFADYQHSRFGGWPWPDDAPVHGREPRRFATHPDGRSERLQMQNANQE
ncbi:MAG TPA: pirin family protein [Burkholderiaceae bacterium]|nr:pirin family protein [Rhodoferax sp.]HQX59178.1 pirin family protein [Burkholderiaceae bacterium]HQZ05462.1 pirin family protein [Burkholderiaceae bacterium]